MDFICPAAIRREPLIASHLRAQPFERAMAAKFPDQRTIFVSWKRPKDLKILSGLLVSTSAYSPA